VEPDADRGDVDDSAEDEVPHTAGAGTHHQPPAEADTGSVARSPDHPQGRTPGIGAEPQVFVAGKRFHREVQAAFVAGLIGRKASDVIERTLIRPGGARERADILLLAPEDPRMRVVVEIKSTLWHAGSAARRRRLLLRHLRQVDGYLDLLLEEVGDTVDTVSAALLYPARPTEDIVTELEEEALPRGIMILFYDDVDWRKA
jgi:hypothetical protein